MDISELFYMTWNVTLDQLNLKKMKDIQTNMVQDILRVILGACMVYASIAHFTFRRTDFQAQVPEWLPMNKDFVVIASGVIELMLGLAMIFLVGQKVFVGIALATFFVLIFPGNIAQYVNHTNAFSLNTDKARLIRLFFQPVLVAWALWSTGVLTYLFTRNVG
jgi:uncharacterized membrane protein